MVVNMEGSSEVEVEFPGGEWLAPDPDLQSEGKFIYQGESSVLHNPKQITGRSAMIRPAQTTPERGV